MNRMDRMVGGGVVGGTSAAGDGDGRRVRGRSAKRTRKQADWLDCPVPCSIASCRDFRGYHIVVGLKSAESTTQTASSLSVEAGSESG